MEKCKRKYIAFVVLLITAVVFCVNSMIAVSRQPENILPVIQRQSEVTSLQSSETITSAFQQSIRVHALSQKCSHPDLNKNWIYKGTRKRQSTFLYSPKYNISYCKVPKTGCTFWTQLFLVLQTDSMSKWREVFQQNREMIHIQSFTNKFSVYFGSKKPSNRTIIVSRDPFSRLYSAYIDKVYLGGLSSEARAIDKYLSMDKPNSSRRHVTRNETILGKSVGCSEDITFSDFLHYVSNRVLSGNSLEPHWIPIASLCPPCGIENVLLARQESFAEDVEYVLNVLNVDKNKTNFIKDVLHDHRFEQTLPGLMQALVSKAHHTFGCLADQDIAGRIWQTMQIQGYIKDGIPFPFNNYSSLSRTMSLTAKSSVLTKVVLDTIKMSPLTSTQSALQRRKFLVNAYKSVDSDTIKTLQRIYYPDFKLFGYSLDPPNSAEPL